MEKTNIRMLEAGEIECRVGMVNEKGCSLLLYKNGRTDMRLLDETFGIFGWKKSHQFIDGNLYCTIDIWDQEKKQWISKQDVGTESYAEKEKGQVSDSFKRAGVCVGIGRELYTAPFIWIPISKVTVKEERGKKVVKDSFRVQSITYDEEKRTIEGLVIVNQENQVVFQCMNVSKDKNKGAKVTLTTEQTAALLEELKRTGISLTSVLRKHNLNKISDRSQDLYMKAMEALRNTADKAA